MNFIFSSSTRYLTRSLRSLVEPRENEGTERETQGVGRDMSCQVIFRRADLSLHAAAEPAVRSAIKILVS